MYINLGGGNFREEGWTNVDYPFKARERKQKTEIDVKHNFMLRKQLPFDDNSVEIVYTEHCIEHLTCHAVEYLLSDIYRILKKGHHLRISCPDFDKVMKLYNDDRVKDIGFNSKLTGKSKEMQVMDILGTPLVDKWDDEQIVRYLSYTDPIRKINDELGDVSISMQSQYPGWHLSCWNLDGLYHILTIIGFRKIKRMGARESKIEVLRSGFLDRTAPDFSLRVECAK